MNAVRHYVTLALLLIAVNGWADDDTSHWVEHNFARQHAALLHQTKQLIIPKIDWKNLSPQQVLDDLSDKCKAADPAHRGISFVAHWNDGTPYRRITFKAIKTSLFEILSHLPFTFMIGNSDITIIDNGFGDYLLSSDYYVPPNAFKIGPANEIPGHPGTYDVRTPLAAKGVRFAPGMSATFLPNKYKLTVVGLDEQVHQVDDILNP